MQGTRASLRYAKALFEASKTEGTAQEVLRDLEVLQNLINEKTEFFNLINNPTISNQKKRELFRTVFQNKLHKTTMQFLFLVLKKGREALLLEIIKKYKALNLESLNIVLAEIVTAKPMSEDIKEKIKKKLSANKKVQLIEKIDESLLGGFIINSGDLQYDASVRKKINNVKSAFKL